MKVNYEPQRTAYDQAWAEQKLCFTQHWAWGDVKSAGWSAHRTMIDGIPLQVLVRKIPLLGGQFGYVPRPFHKASIPQPDSLAELSRQLCDRLSLSHLIWEPNIWETAGPEAKLVSAGFRLGGKPIQARHSRFIDLSRSDDQLWSDLKKDVRRRATRAEQDGLTVREASDRAGVERFYTGLQVVGSRAKFDIYSQDYYQQIMKSFGPEMARVYLVEKNAELLYSLFAMVDNGFFRRLFGGPTLLGRRTDAAQFVAWQAILTAKGLNCHTLDLWGMAPVTEDGAYQSNHPLASVSRFKASLGGRDITYWPQLIWVRQPSRFVAYRSMVRAHDQAKKIKAQDQVR